MTLLWNVLEHVLDLFWNVPEGICFVVGHTCCRVRLAKPIESRAGAGLKIEREHTHVILECIHTNFMFARAFGPLRAFGCLFVLGLRELHRLST